MDINTIIQNIHPLPQSSIDKILKEITLISLPKAHLLFSEGKIDRNIYFIKKGIARAFFYHNGNDVSFWFGREGETILSMRTYVDLSPGYENIELLEDCELYKFNFNPYLQSLFDEDIHIANWGRKYAEKELMKTERNFMSRQFKTASERYAELLEKHPDLIQRVQLGHIASYLGITQVTLSRIRAGIG